MWLPKAVIASVDEAVDEVFLVTYQATRVFNETRDPGEPLVFSGWYWAKGALEGGPFKSQSSAYRDAWFRLVRKQVPPQLHKGHQAWVRKERRAKLKVAA